MASVDLENVSLTFHVRPTARLTLKDYIVRREVRKAAHARKKVRALQEIDLHLKDGDRLGIVGHNGAGKSSLLRLLAGIYPPTRGRRHILGRVSSLFEITLGFELEATGWENIAYRGYLQGETPRSVRAKAQSIAEFTELGDFLDMPVRYYSAGMMVRLAFSIATSIEPEILLVDEVLSVGDLAFQHKARQRMREMIAKASLIVLVSHDLRALPGLCNQGLWMDHGRIHRVGRIDEVIDAYTAEVRAQADLPAAPAPPAAA
jgi:ABC-type polysaccharide/polyol phosphate transport system ATPase subunit